MGDATKIRFWHDYGVGTSPEGNFSGIVKYCAVLGGVGGGSHADF